MAKYQRGAVVTPKAHTKGPVKIYTRRVTASIKASTQGTVKKGTRGVTVKIEASTRGTVKIYTRRIKQAAKEFDLARAEKGDDQSGVSGVSISDPGGNYNFQLFIGDDKEPVAHFMEASGLKNSSAAYEIQEGGLNGRTHKRVGQGKWENIVLRYGTSANTRLAEWRDQYLRDMNMTDKLRTESKTSSGAIVMLNNRGEPMRRFEFEGAWPVSWEGPSLASGGSALALETIEIAHNGLFISEAK